MTGLLTELAERALAKDDDHIVADEGESLAWLIAQLACWPVRVDPDCTTNIRFLMLSAAATLSAQAQSVSPSSSEGE